MDNDVFKALSSTTRLKMLRILAKREMHITGLARELNLSVPVVAKHSKLLEKSGLIEIRKFGKTHVLGSKMKNVYNTLDELADSYEIKLHRGASILEALRKVSGVELKTVGDREFVMAIDGEKGLYIYEVNGNSPNSTTEEFKIENDCTIEWKKLIPVTRKRISVKIK
ncbi:ArsR family transcriptional regulator [Candidatus Methanoperedens nitratireducens]|uniref:Transcriptional regulator, ArsR family n=1 Tax=Candidatus Methanoperedens nitratireducens TaxID=1392998 RepID=A0A284VLG5_9EURY|nr:ArsR family transcriptional regulator [Candidatus Methanoperedens nitroreducens]SNQ60120.1 Transcriptional regulator, ArsR family [Candidatus Methanoperedens nitroreducens]